MADDFRTPNRPRMLTYAGTLQLFVSTLDRADIALVHKYSGVLADEIPPSDETRLDHLGFRYERFLKALHELGVDTEGERDGVTPELGECAFSDLLADLHPLLSYRDALQADAAAAAKRRAPGYEE